MAGETDTAQTVKKTAAVKVFDCPNCGAGVVLRAFGQTVSVVCGSCGSIIDATNENYRVLSKAASILKLEPAIPLGQKGKIRGDTWEVIGFMQRTDGSGDYAWCEYLLFNPFKGFRWLTEMNGHWNYVIMIKDKPALQFGSEATYLGHSFKLFEKGVAKVNYVIGEFYWRVKVGETVNVEDYIRPPQMLSSEGNKEEIVWSLSEYIEPEAIRTEFNVIKEFPERTGVAPDQPSNANSDVPRLMAYWGILVFVVFDIQFFNVVLSKNLEVFNQTFQYKATGTEKTKITPSFELTGGKSNVQIRFDSPVKNNWLELDGTLVNEKTGENFDFEVGVEYYYGYDIDDSWRSDGFWSEGSQVHEVVLSSIPAGTYHLNFQVVGPVEPEIPAKGAQEQQPVVTPANAEMKFAYWPNRAIKSMTPWVKGTVEGIVTFYHDNGKLQGEVPYRHGHEEGSFKLYTRDGLLDKQLSYTNGQLNGTCTWFNRDGSVEKVAEYKYGQEQPPRVPDLPYAISVRRAVVTWLDSLFTLILLSIYPLYVWLRSRSFEQSRWSTSDYSP